MTDPRLDLSPLDPARDRLRWERLVRETAARGAAGAARRRPAPLARQLAAWARPGLALAAAASLVAWVPSWLRPATPAAAPATTSATSTATAAPDAAARLAAWAARDDGAGAEALLLALGADDDAH